MTDSTGGVDLCYVLFWTFGNHILPCVSHVLFQRQNFQRVFHCLHFPLLGESTILDLSSFAFAATVRPVNALTKHALLDFGKYVSECFPKWVQKAQVLVPFIVRLLFSKCPCPWCPSLTELDKLCFLSLFLSCKFYQRWRTEMSLKSWFTEMASSPSWLLCGITLTHSSRTSLTFVGWMCQRGNIDLRWG